MPRRLPSMVAIIFIRKMVSYLYEIDADLAIYALRTVLWRSSEERSTKACTESG